MRVAMRDNPDVRLMRIAATDRGGRRSKEVATLLNIVVKTVEFHMFKIMDELNLHSTAALTRHALAEGLVGP